MRNLTRRDFLKGTAAVAGTALAAPALAGAPSGKLTAWGIQTFAVEGDKLIGEQMQEFGKLKNVPVEYVVVPYAEMPRKLTAAIEAKAPPDLVMLSGQNIQYYRNKGHLVELTDVMNDIKKQGGGIYESVLPQSVFQGKSYAIPFEPEVAPLHVRTDIFKKNGITLPITTWGDFTEACKKINNPPKFYGWAMVLGRCPDAHWNILHVIWAHGGKLVESDGKTVALKSEATLAALKLIAQWFQKDKIIPPDTVTADDAWNNKVYQSGMAGVIDNQASVYGWLEKNDKELWNNTSLMRHPRGPAGSFQQTTSWAWAIFNISKNVDLAKEMIRYWLEPSRFDRVVQTIGGRWWPIYKDLAKGKFWADRPNYAIYPEMLAQARLDAFAGPPTDASGEVFERLIYPDMVQKVIVGGETPEKALDWAYGQVREIYSRHFKS
jgi:multiple sugar transport system substrate-binding protein